MADARRLPINDPAALRQACVVIQSGAILAYPTDTLYGLGADATNAGAVDRLNRLKGRSGPLSVIAPDANTALRWSTLNPGQYKLARPYLGGPQTLILPVRPGLVVPAVLGPGDTLGIRVPDQSFILRVAAATGVPITTTSVNRSGQPPLNDPELIMESFGSEIALLIDAGQLQESPGSVIYRWISGRIELIKRR
ncbi:MAG: L-threonylcarbamoyladenylate synthase [Candidatus Neomarinimicrobiota bacterium]